VATKEKKRDKKVAPPPVSTEVDKVNGWRKEQFQKLLPDVSENRIDDLVASTSSPHDLDDLLEKKCPPDLAIRILA
jgi:hypothetical protein